jgi:uncharacterized protein (DUF4415 family)
MVALPTSDAPTKKSKLLNEFVNGANEGAPKARRHRKKPRTLRLHPDVMDALERHAKSERKTFAELVRELVSEYMKAKGIDLD